MPRFAVQLMRYGATVEDAGVLDGSHSGVPVPYTGAVEAWGWPQYALELPVDLRDGVYLAVPVPLDADGSPQPVPADKAVATRPDAAAFVLRRRPRREGGVLVKLPTATYSAYNQLGGISLYATPKWVRDWSAQGYAVSLQRPGNCGVGGRVMEGDAPDPYARDSRRQTFAHWDAPFVAWCEARGIEPDYCTDYDLHFDPACLDGYALLVSVGHDEYWSSQMRARVLDFVDRGGNMCFFAGDVACFEVSFAGDGDTMYCRKMNGDNPDNPLYRHPGGLWYANDPDNWLTLSTGVYGGGWWDGRRNITGYRLAVPDHWAFDGVTEPGEGITGGADTPIVGYETDGVMLSRADDGMLRLGDSKRGGVTGRVLLAAADLGAGWVTNGIGANAAMVTRTARSGGIVVTTGTTDWPLGLGHDPAVDAITANLLSRLALPSLRLHGPVWAQEIQIGDGELVPAGVEVTWYIDGAQLLDRGLESVAWTVRGGTCIGSGNQVVTVADDGSQWLTLVATATDASGTSYFGSRTVRVVGHEEFLRRRVVRLLSALAFPDEQGGALVDQGSSEEDLAARVIPVRVAYAQRRLAELSGVLDELVASWSQSTRMDDASLRPEELG
jgi:hypothetical protein